MRRILSVLACFLLVLGCTSAPSSPPAKGPPVVAELSRATVALVAERGFDVRPFCTGTWISATEILTAAHCVREDDDVALKIDYLVSETGRIHTAGVVKYDPTADLALLADIFPPMHGYVDVARWAPPQGAEVHVMGQLRGLWWTYLHGYVATASRELDTSLGIEGPFLQIEAPIAPGSSGGGCFNSYGELVGVASFTRRDVPSEGFFIHTDTIRRFLGKV